MKIGDKVKHKAYGDYGLVVECPQCWKLPGYPSQGWVLWLTGEKSFGKVLWENPINLQVVEFN